MATPPPPSLLDADQCITGAYNEAKGALRVDVSTDLSFVGGNLEVAISHVDDSIKIGDGTRLAGVTAAGALKTDASATTQPVSGSVAVSNFPATQAVTGTFFQSTQPVSGAFFQATQPISGTVGISGTVPVSGTFFQTTQPVSGTFFQATQPVSIAASVAVTGPLTDTQLRAAPVPVSGTITANVGTTNGLALDASVNSLLKPASTLAAVTAITNTVTIKADTAANQTNLLKVDGSGATQPVSAASLPLPSGASTAANQATANTSLSSIDSKLTSPLTVTGPLTDTQLRATAVPVSGTFFQTTQPVSAASLPLPSGASTAANQTTANTSLASIDTKAPTLGQALAAASVPVVLTAAQLSTLSPLSSVSVSNFPATQPVSAASLPLPAGASTEATLSSLNTKVPSNLTVTSTRLLVDGSGVTQPVSGTVTANSASDSATGAAPPASATLSGGSVTTAAPSYTTGQMNALSLSTTGNLRVDGSGVTQPVSGTVGSTQSGAWNITNVSGTVSLPTGASTSALQTTGNTSLSSIDSKVPSNLTVTSARLLVDGSGVTQPITAASLPLPAGAATSTKQPALGTAGTASADVITVQGIASMTALKVDGSAVTQPISIASSVAVTGPLTDTQLRASAVPVSGTFFQATQPISGSVSVSNFPATQPISAASLPLPSGAATSALQTTGNTSLASIDAKLTNPLPVSGTVTATNASVSATGAAPPSSATYAGGSVTTAAPSYTTGQMSALSLTTTGALRVDNSANTQPISGTIAATQSGTWNVGNITGTVSLPTGAATSALQTSGNASLSSIDAKLTSPITITGALTDTQLRTTPVPVSGTVAATQSGTWTVQPGNTANTTAWKVDGSAVTQPVSGTVAATQSGAWNITNVTGTVSLPTGAATSALQTTGNTSLSSIDGKVPANLTVTSTRLLVDGSGVTQPVSIAGTVAVSGPLTDTQLRATAVPVSGTFFQATQPVSIAASVAVTGPLTDTQLRATAVPVSGTVAATQSGTWNIANISGTVSLPTGAATEVSLAKLTQAQGSTTTGQSGALIQGAVTTAAPTYTTAQTNPLSLTTAGALRVDSSANTQPVSGTVAANQGGTWNINNVSGTVSLPTGASTSALQTTGNSSLSSIDTKTPALGQALAAASVPVVLTAAQLTALTPLSTVAVTQSTSPWVVSGTVTAANASVSTTGSAPPPSATYVGGSVTTAAPAYTTGQMSALSLTTTGGLRVDGSAVTQPVSGPLTDTQLRASAVPVSGTFFPSTQPVSIAATVAVSGPLTDTQLRATPVPVSGTVSANATLAAETTKVIGTVNIAVGQSITSNAGTNTSTANLDVALSTRLKPADTLAGVTTVGAVTSITNALPAGANLLGKVGIDQTTPGTTNKVSIGTDGTVALNAAIPPGANRIGSVRIVDSSDVDLTTTKGIQTTRSVGVQNLKDSGRVNVNFYATGVAAGATGVETLITMTKSSGTGATTSAGTFVITSGKRFRITSVSFATRDNVIATAQITTFNMRINTVGAVTTASTPIILSARSGTPASSLGWDRVTFPISDGMEILGDGTLQFGISANAVYVTNAPTWDVTLTGFEY